MKVFVSSLITGMEAERAAVVRAVRSLGHAVIRAEDFGALPTSPQVACLDGVRSADLVVLILADRYGAKQRRGFSATHEEFLEARGKKPVLLFLRSGVTHDPEQQAFVDEVSGWEGGLYREAYTTPESLGDAVVGALHRYVLANAAAPLDPKALASHARSLLPEVNRHNGYSDSRLSIAIAAGPSQALLRPAELEDQGLGRDLHKEAVFGDHPVLDHRLGGDTGIEDGAFVIVQRGQRRREAIVRLWESGDVLFEIPASRDEPSRGLSAVLEEDIAEQLEAALAYTAWTLTRIDPTERVSHVALAVRLEGGGTFGWRTRAEHAKQGSSGPIQMFGREEERDAPVQLNPPTVRRSALTMTRPRLVEDLLVLLRRQWQKG